MNRAFIAIVLAMAAGTASSATAFLSSQWLDGANRMCKYTNGTVLNVGVGLCPLSI